MHTPENCVYRDHMCYSRQKQFNRYAQHPLVLRFAHKIRFETARRIVPFEPFAVPVPQFHAVFLFAVFVTEIVRFASIPISECDWSATGHPEEVSFVGQISARGPEVLVTQTCIVTTRKIRNYYYQLTKSTNDINSP